jgi:hypothetical protein
MVIQNKDSQYTLAFNDILTQGAHKQLESSGEIIKNFSPNNVRRVIIGLDGIFVQYYVSNGVSRKEFFQELKMTDRLLEEVCNPNNVYRSPLMLLRGKGKVNRIYSSIEEIIVLHKNPNFPEPFNNSGIDWFINAEDISSSFKRLRCVTLIDEPVTMQMVLKSVQTHIQNPLITVSDRIPFQHRTKVFNDELYLTRTSLRPQYYELDSAGGALDNYFNKVKEMYKQMQVAKQRYESEPKAIADDSCIGSINGVDVRTYLESYLELIKIADDSFRKNGFSSSDKIPIESVMMRVRQGDNIVERTSSSIQERQFNSVNYAGYTFKYYGLLLSTYLENLNSITEEDINITRKLLYILTYLPCDIDSRFKSNMTLKDLIKKVKKSSETFNEKDFAFLQSVYKSLKFNTTEEQPIESNEELESELNEQVELSGAPELLTIDEANEPKYEESEIITNWVSEKERFLNLDCRVLNSLYTSMIPTINALNDTGYSEEGIKDRAHHVLTKLESLAVMGYDDNLVNKMLKKRNINLKIPEDVTKIKGIKTNDLDLKETLSGLCDLFEHKTPQKVKEITNLFKRAEEKAKGVTNDG